MKPKHYPHITMAAAVLLLLLPASLLVLIPKPQSQSADDLLAEADLDSRQIETTTEPVRGNNKPAVAIDQRPATRVAMLPDTVSDQVGGFQSADQDLYVETKPAPVPKSKKSTAYKAETYADVANVMVPEEPQRYAPQTTTDTVADTQNDTEDDMADSSDVGGHSAEDLERDDRLARELDETLAQGSTTQNTHFQSTGHLAMSKAIASDTKSPMTKRTRRTGTSARSRMDEESGPSGVMGTMPAGEMEDPFSSEPNSPIVDVVLQQPFEQRPVQKVENLIATTQQPGWPIALVRSDIPGDAWWVQQMVGIRHRSFASRVNFGNNDSLPGSVYHLVIVFLDSADEARRFRIAKQFKDIPEGLRRSREYTFVRK